jgi:NAD(P) transhydrogenase subunit alpha
MLIGLPKETTQGETRVALTPDAANKLLGKGYKIIAERSCGLLSGFPDANYPADGLQWGDAKDAFAADIVLKINRPSVAEVALLKKGAVLITQIDPFKKDGLQEKLAQAGVETLSMELIPRSPRSQTMDMLTSQANISGYRAVIEAAARYGRFFPLMMTAAGSARPAKVMVLGAGVAGLQAIATARRLGAIVEAYDVRPEAKEQIQSLGAKCVEIDIGEDGSGQGGYAKELSEAAKQRQTEVLAQRLQACDIIISTANIPGRKAPILITEDTVQKMRPGSVIVDLAAANGGNCPLTEADKVVVKHGVTLVGFTNYPAMMPADSSSFYANNVVALLDLIVEQKDSKPVLNLNLEDNIIAATLVTHLGDIR